jgi:hypothetical protein
MLLPKAPPLGGEIHFQQAAKDISIKGAENVASITLQLLPWDKRKLNGMSLNAIQDNPFPTSRRNRRVRALSTSERISPPGRITGKSKTTLHSAAVRFSGETREKKIKGISATTGPGRTEKRRPCCVAARGYYTLLVS